LLAVLVLVASGCWRDSIDSRSATAGLPTLRQELEAHDWLLDRSRSSVTIGGDSPVTLNIHEDAASGTGPCNVYGATFTLDGRDVEFADIVHTLQACEPPVMQAEDQYFRALEASDTVKVSDGRLVLGTDGQTMVFERFDAAAALPGVWSVVSVATPAGLTSVAPGTAPTVTFASDETLALDAGCNLAASSWEVDGDVLSIDPIRLTRKNCDTPPGVMEQESSLVAALESAARVDVAPQTLKILDDHGDLVLVAVQKPGPR
jgi:heat shock protein HslJ